MANDAEAREERCQVAAAMAVGIPASGLTIWRNPSADYAEFMGMTALHCGGLITLYLLLAFIVLSVWVLVRREHPHEND